MNIRLLFTFIAVTSLTGCAGLAEMAEEQNRTRCTESGAYEMGYNSGNSGRAMNSGSFADCKGVTSDSLRAAYQKGFREGKAAIPAGPSTIVVVPPTNRTAPVVPRGFSTCGTMKPDASGKNCFSRFDGDERGRCEVCVEQKSCFMALGSGTGRSLCEAYRENKKCFMALNAGFDRSWCEHLKEGKSCDEAFPNPTERRLCILGRMPDEHLYWFR